MRMFPQDAIARGQPVQHGVLLGNPKPKNVKDELKTRSYLLSIEIILVV